MFENINGARLAAKRVQETFGLKSSLSKEITARAGGWRDWHHLEQTIGRQNSPRQANAKALRNYLAAKTPAISMERLVDVAMPGTKLAAGEDHLDVMAKAPRADIIDAALEGRLMDAQRDAEIDGGELARSERDGIEISWLYAPNERNFAGAEDDPDGEWDGVSDDFPGTEEYPWEPRNGSPGRVGYSFHGVSVHDIQWIVRDDSGRPIAAAFASLVSGMSGDWMDVFMEIDDSPMADGELLMSSWGNHRQQYYMDLAFLTINAIEVEPDMRGRGVGTRLMHRMIEDVRSIGHEGNGVHVIADASDHGRITDRKQQIAFAAWLARPEITDVIKENLETDGVEVHVGGKPYRAFDGKPPAASARRRQLREMVGRDTPLRRGEWPAGRDHAHAASGDFDPPEDLISLMPSAYESITAEMRRIDYTSDDRRRTVERVILTLADGGADELTQADIEQASPDATHPRGVAAWNLAAAYARDTVDDHITGNVVLNSWSSTRGQPPVVDAHDYSDLPDGLGYRANVAMGIAGENRREDRTKAFEALARDIVQRGRMLEGVATPWGDIARLPDFILHPERHPGVEVKLGPGDDFTFGRVRNDVDPLPDEEGKTVTWGDRLDAVYDRLRRDAMPKIAELVAREVPEHADPNDPLALFRKVPHLGQIWRNAHDMDDFADFEWIMAYAEPRDARKGRRGADSSKGDGK